MFTACKLRVNRQRLGKTPRDRVFEGAPLFTWALNNDRPDLAQSAYRLTLTGPDGLLFDSGRVETAESRCDGPANLPACAPLALSLTLWDENGLEGAPVTETVYRGDADWTAKWIAPSEDEESRTAYFRKGFSLPAAPVYAVLRVCGLGYHHVKLNDTDADDALLDPAHTDWSRRVQYAVIPEVQTLLRAGENRVDIALGEGWRRNNGPYLDPAPAIPDFFGRPQLSAELSVTCEDGTRVTLTTDSTWQWRRGPLTYNHLFNGTVYDARQTPCGEDGFRPAETVPAPAGKPEPMLIPPIREREVFRPIALSRPAEGVTVVDFGQNIAGVIRLRLHDLTPGQEITVRHMELLDAEGQLYLPNLRSAKAQDTYIAAGDGRDLAVWQPEFTYHGFRYAAFTGLALREEDVEAVQIATDLDKGTTFRSGSAILNAFHHNVLMTERDNQHSILTDCPQRDERMGWMNDATVRFEETPFNFDTGAMFRKVVRDIAGSQGEDGAIACTAPMVYGSRPADPVCTSYLMAAWQNWLHNGDAETMAENFDGFAAWEQCLLDRSEGFIVQYSYYGDWAGPAYACVGEDGAVSAVTPGLLMSTGYSYLNCRLLSRFAEILGKAEEKARWAETAEKVRGAMLQKWYDPKTAMMATGSQGCQAFALWLGILPEEDRARAAEVMRNDLVARGLAFTTGNLCTRYLLDMLTEYGYENEAYALMTSEEYPSFGFELQQEATTVWERFEMKKNPGMNSHNHPMYAAADAWLFTGLAGIRPLDAGFARCAVKPAFPEKLQSLQTSVDTIRGRLTVKWLKRYGELNLYLDVPPQMVCAVTFDGQTREVGPGTHRFTAPLDK